MKKSVLFMALMAVTMTAGAQRSDLYSTGRSNTGKSSATASSVTASPVQADPVQAAPVVTTTPKIIVDRDPDEYNRRYTYGTSQIQYEDGTYLDDVPTIYIHDTIYVSTREPSGSYYDDEVYMEGYNDAIEDYNLTRRLYRFRRAARPHYYSLYDDLFWDILYWDYYWDTDYWYFSHTYYYDPWYYDGWYYDPWYGTYYYGHYYYGYYAPHYTRYYPVYVSSSPRVEYYTPNRSINNGGWDRNLSRSTTSRTASFGSSASRTVTSASSGIASRSVGAHWTARLRCRSPLN